MKIGLIDVDNAYTEAKFPNLALMKLSAFHKQAGDQVEWYDSMNHYDIVYGSQVFDFSMPMVAISNADKVIIGGRAIDHENKLPHEVEHMMPDYSLYGVDRAYGFLTRGCPRNCGFCDVTQHQGPKSLKVADLSEFWTDQKEIVLLDPNTYACRDWRLCHEQLENSGALIDFSQGVDIRVMTDEKVAAINRLNIKMLHFAWDNYEFKTYELLKHYRSRFNVRGRNLRVYVLTNFETTHEQDVERVMKLRELDYDPYVMIYEKDQAPRVTRRLQRWVNSKPIWRTIDNFEDYGKKQEETMDGQMSFI